MKSRAVLKSIRVIVALLIITPFTFLFIDFAGYDLTSIKWLPKIQLTPTIMSVLSGTALGLLLIIMLVITLLLGRVYCSVICPFGILQDVLRRIFNPFKSKKQKRYRYSSPSNILRYSVLALCIVLFAFGSISLILYLDPYSNFGRIAANIMRPVYIGLNNLAVTVLGWFDNYSLYYVSVNYEAFAFWFSLVAFLTIAVLVFLRGRLFCNTLCPVGALLSLVSRYSIFKLDFDKDKCTKCGACERKCKSQCISVKQQTLVFSRCITCYNCINSCKWDAMNYRFAGKIKSKKIEQELSVDNMVAEPVTNSRRRFFSTAIITVGAVSLAFAQRQKTKLGGVAYTKKFPVTPPGAKSIEHLKSRCTACHLCVAQCPTQVIKPAFMEYGLGGMMMPRMDYIQSFCNFECTVCSEVCPNGALQPLTVEEKKVAQIGKVFFERQLCVVYTDNTDCGACSEHCPTKAVDMVPYKDGLTIPEINQDICIGCGGCEFICPVRPLRAIYVDGNSVHQTAQKPVEEGKKELDNLDFGF